MLSSDEFIAVTTTDSVTSQHQLENSQAREENYNFEDDDRSRIHENNLRAWSRSRTSSESSTMVDHNIEICQREHRDSPGGRNATMAFLADKFPHIFVEVEPFIKEMASDFLEYVCGEVATSSRRYVSDVFVPTSVGEIDTILELLRQCGRARRKGLYGFSSETDHVHIIHDCSWGGSHCRCVFKEKIRPYGLFNKPRKFVKRLFEFKKLDWYDVFLYFFVEKRGERGLWINGASGRLPSDAELVRWADIAPKREMVRLQNNGNFMLGKRQKDHSESGGTSHDVGAVVYGKKPNKGLYGSIKDECKKILFEYWVAPISGIQTVDKFRNNILLDNPANLKYVNAALGDFAKDIAKLSLREIYNILQEGDPKFFLSMEYANLEESVSWVNDLLKYQFNDDEESISKFLTNIVNILDKKLPKRNALCVVSAPSAGKNFFFDMIFAICLSYGQLGMANRNNTFAFQEAVNKRLIVWNEPNYEPILTDTIKMMMAGDPYTVKVKHSLDGHVSRTPIIVLTNNYVPFMTDEAFNDRIFIYKWQAAPFLKNFDKKPFPMAFFEILNMYMIDF